MGAPKNTLARIIANRSMQRLHQSLKPMLIAARVRSVEERIGRPQLFFQRARERPDAFRVSDYLATCAVLDREPGELLTTALSENPLAEIRPPRIVARARKHISSPGSGLGADQLAELDRSFNSDPKKTLEAVKLALPDASRDELPRLLGIYGSALRVEADLSHAALVLRHALAMARDLKLPDAAADLFIRLAYVALDRQGPEDALKHAQEGTLAYTRLGDEEGQAKGFLALGMFRYYSHDYREALSDFQTALERSHVQARIVGSYQFQALCWIELDEPDNARDMAALAQKHAVEVAPWMQGKLSWLQARLAFGNTRCHHLKAAQTDLATSRPGDALMATLELIEEYLDLDQLDNAGQEIPAVCTLVERAGECRQVQERVSRLIQHRSRLTPNLIADLRRALDRARDRRLSNVIQSD